MNNTTSPKQTKKQITVDPWIIWRLGVLIPCVVESPHITFDSPKNLVVPWYLWGIGYRTPSRIPISAGAQIPHIKMA